MSNFFNRAEGVVDEMLEAVACTADVRLLRDGQGIRIVAREDWDCSRVVLISGAWNECSTMVARAWVIAP